MDITSTEHEETLTNKNVYTLHAYYENFNYRCAFF